MTKIGQLSKPQIILIPLLTILALLSPQESIADLCETVGAEFYFAHDDEVDEPFFEKYLIGKKNGAYYIHAQKTVAINYFRLLETYQDYTNYPQFMLGYKGITVEEISDTELITAIHFDPPMSPFTSRFSNEVQVKSSFNRYQQCWRQLPADDSRVKETFKNAPKVNQGYWLVEKIDNTHSKISYHCAIKPPIRIPLWLYRFFVENSYVEVFQRIIDRASK